jgi:hypothetical protein
MPSWSEIGKEIEKEKSVTGQNAFDVVRRRYLRLLAEKTGRPVIMYAAKWTQMAGVDASLLMINDEDIQGMMEMLCGLNGNNGLDLILHSPGGSAEASEAIVKYLRSKFSDIRVFVPLAAMSAACMLACSANRIVMGKHSSLGPIDPQMVLGTPLGNRLIPAQAILDQFSRAQRECQDPRMLASWMPMLQQYGPALLVQCREAIQLSEALASQWLEDYMYAKDPKAKEKAQNAAKFLADHSNFLSHGRHIDREQAKKWLVIEDLEENQEVQDLVLSAFHATTRTFDGTGAVKIIENNDGKAFCKVVNVIMIPEGPSLSPPASPQRPEKQTAEK